MQNKMKNVIQLREPIILTFERKK